MALLVELSGEVPDLARHEGWATASTLSGEEERLLLVDGPVMVLEGRGVSAAELAGRLGLAHHVCSQAVSGDVGSASRLAAGVDIGGAGTFRVRARRTDLAPPGPSAGQLEVEAGAMIADRTGVRVDLETPEAEVRLVLAERAHAGLLGGSVDRRGLEARAVKHRPFSHPISLHPKFSRAMLNVARVPVGGRILDPFCGTGGMLIEAALLGYQALGSDIDPRMVSGSRTNLEAQGLEASLEVADVREAGSWLSAPPDAIVTDPPYGRSTSLHGGSGTGVLEGLYSMAAEHLPEGGRLVVCLPEEGMVPAEGTGFEVDSVHPMKVHRSLTRHVCVLRNHP
jgi:tRNA (guanine10-N2)-dimethyltransferase